MRSRLMAGAAVCSLAAACSSSPEPSPTAPHSQTSSIDLLGTWNGTGVDSMGTIGLTWALTQTGATVSGTVQMQSLDAAGSCNSCHRTKSGTFSGTISGSTLALTMYFPGNPGELTPACSATLTGTASNFATRTFNVAYSGVDSCEPPADNGSAVMHGQ